MNQVSLIPAHPSYGVISMLKYWQCLTAEHRSEDPFDFVSVLGGSPSVEEIWKRSMIEKAYFRKFWYPLKIRSAQVSGIAHILDHSWADLLPFVPKQAIKVVTVHDLIPLRFPGELSKAQTGRYRKWAGHLPKADAIIAVSDYTKREVVELLGIDPRKIHVVFNGVELPPESKVPTTSGTLPGDRRQFRIGSIGSTLERKNLGILPEALARLQASIPDKVVLVRVGSALPVMLAAAIRKELGEDGLVELGRLPDAAIGDYYAGLDAVVIPSLYEGFGLPVIEGMAARVPVVASNASSLPEVGGDAVLYFNPESPKEFADQLTLVAEGGLPPDFVEKAYQRASLFTWRRTLEGYYDVYRSLLES